MSIKMKIALALLVAFVVGAGVLMGTMRVAFTRNVGLAAEATLEDVESQFEETRALLGESDPGVVLQSLQRQTGDDYSLLLAEGDSYAVAASTSDELGTAALGSVPDELSGGVNRAEIQVSGDDKYLVAAIPVDDAVGGEAGIILVRSDIGPLYAEMSGSPMLVLLVMLGIYALVVGVVLVLLNRLVFSRLQGITGMLEDSLVRMAGGDYAALDIERDVSDDELGRFEETVLSFLRAVGATLKSLSLGAAS